MPKDAVTFAQSSLMGLEDTSPGVSALCGAMRSDPDRVLGAIEAMSPIQKERFAGYVLSESGGGEYFYEDILWPIDPTASLPLPVNVRTAKIRDALDGLGLDVNKVGSIRKKLKWWDESRQREAR